ncbi:MAG: superoxide dismutase [Candidatus Micrarchaeales archaeon]
MAKRYELPALPYAYNALEPYISEQIMKLHHDKHHAVYVNGANAALEKLEKARSGEMQIDIRAVLRDFGFNYCGQFLHSLFWLNMAQPGKGGGNPGGALGDEINRDFSSFEKFKQQFSDAANTVEGSGWAVLQYDKATDQLLIAQVEKHSMLHFANLPIIMCLDVWEHAYYLDYQNKRVDYIKAWWNVVNWEDIAQRFEEAKK